MVSRLESAYAGRARFTRYTMDAIKPGERAEMQRLASLVAFEVTPTFVVVDRHGRITAKYQGVTSYWTLASAIDRALAP
jgi:hypothetical protein